MNVDDVVQYLVGAPRDGVEQLVAREHRAGTPGERHEEAELRGREPAERRRAGAAHARKLVAPRSRVDDQPATSERQERPRRTRVTRIRPASAEDSNCCSRG